MNLLETKFQYYPSNVKVLKPLGEISLKYFLDSHKKPKKSIKAVIDRIRNTTDPTEKAKQKKKLFYFTPSVFTDKEGRSYENIISFTGIMVMEFDKIQHLEELKLFLMERLKSCICAYVSPSGKGVKTLIRIPIVKTVQEYKEYFYGIAYYFEKYLGFDPSNQNPMLPLFISYDTNILINENAEEWTIKGEKIDEFKEHVGEIKKVKGVSATDRRKIKSILLKMLHKIEEEAVGHPNVVKTSLVAGGYVAAGYYSEEELLEWMLEKLEDIEYLQKGLYGYKKTCMEMIKKGQSSPLYL